MVTVYPLQRSFSNHRNQELLFNIEQRIVLLIDTKQQQPIQAVHAFSEGAFRGLLALLIFEECPDEYLLACLSCPMPLLLRLLHNAKNTPLPQSFMESAEYFRTITGKPRRESEKSIGSLTRAIHSLTNTLPSFGFMLSRITSFGYQLLPSKRHQTGLHYFIANS